MKADKTRNYYGVLNKSLMSNWLKQLAQTPSTSETEFESKTCWALDGLLCYDFCNGALKLSPVNQTHDTFWQWLDRTPDKLMSVELWHSVSGSSAHFIK